MSVVAHTLSFVSLLDRGEEGEVQPSQLLVAVQLAQDSGMVVTREHCIRDTHAPVSILLLGEAALSTACDDLTAVSWLFWGLTPKECHLVEPCVLYSISERRMCPLCFVPGVHKGTHHHRSLHQYREALVRAAWTGSLGSGVEVLPSSVAS